MTNNMGEALADPFFVFAYEYGLVCVALMVTVNVILALKVFQDARPRVGKHAIVHLILTLACGPPGCLFWLLVRPNRRLCATWSDRPISPPPPGPPPTGNP